MPYGTVTPAGGAVAAGSITVAKLAQATIDALDPWYIAIDVLIPPNVNTNWAASFENAVTSGGQLKCIDAVTSGAQNDAASWPVNLAAGTWKLQLFHSKGANRGIYTFKVDGVSVGTIDGYNAAGTAEVLDTFSFAVATTNVHTLQVIMATQNVASAGFFALVAGLTLQRTA